MTFFMYSLVIHIPVDMNMMSNHAIMLQLIMVGIHNMEAQLRDKIGNEQPIFQI